MVLEVNNLKTHFYTDAGVVKAVEGISYCVSQQEIIALVGESGCGKSVSQLSVLQLVSRPGKIVEGEVLYEGQDLLQYHPKGREMRAIRGKEIAMIFQEPMSSLNPVFSIGNQLTEMLKLHLGMDKNRARKRAVELLEMVGISAPSTRIDDYPHQFSGGMLQRVMIAMGLSCEPKILIADEPTTALDVTTQAQLLELMEDVVKRFGTSLVLVTHNLGIVARYAQRIYVMYAGKIVEEGKCREVFNRPQHPYTEGLLKCVPRFDDFGRGRLEPISGMPPNQLDMPSYCSFLPRCPYATEECKREEAPELRLVEGTDHLVRCHKNIEERVNVNA